MPRHLKTIQELARIFFEFSYWHEMEQTPFKPRAYQLASESLTALDDEVRDTWRRGGVPALMDLPAIGQSTAEKIDEYLRTGHIKEYEEIKKKFPVDIWSLSRIEGVGPRHIQELYKHLGVRSVADLKRALDAHKVRDIPRWGEKSEEKLAKGLELLNRSSGRRLLGEILPIADTIVTALSMVPGVKHCLYAGSLRRKQETVGDIDLIATSSKPEAVMKAFVTLPLVEAIHEQGKTRASVRLSIGIDADLRVVPDNVYGATLQYFTGDKRHNVMLREYALSKGFTLNEYGLFRTKRKGPEHGKGSLVVCKTEEEIYKKLGMDCPPPEIRIGHEEIDAARKHALPKLIPYGSLKGDLQVQTEWTDGHASIKEMATAAKAAGLSYMAVTDHTKSLAFLGGLTDKKVAEQAKEIAKVNASMKSFKILRGTECDVLQDGSLDLDDNTLASLDWVGISIHSHFKLSRAAQTERLVKAMSNPNVDCVFHPTCRLIGKRDGIDLDMDEVIAAAKKYRVALEVNAFPERSDLRDIHAHAAVKAGVALVINSDAHAIEHFKFLPLGIAIARRGWATSSDVLNTRHLPSLLAYLDKKRQRHVS